MNLPTGIECWEEENFPREGRRVLPRDVFQLSLEERRATEGRQRGWPLYVHIITICVKALWPEEAQYKGWGSKA